MSGLAIEWWLKSSSPSWLICHKLPITLKRITVVCHSELIVIASIWTCSSKSSISWLRSRAFYLTSTISVCCTFGSTSRSTSLTRICLVTRFLCATCSKEWVTLAHSFSVSYFKAIVKLSILILISSATALAIAQRRLGATIILVKFLSEVSLLEHHLASIVLFFRIHSLSRVLSAFLLSRLLCTLFASFVLYRLRLKIF